MTILPRSDCDPPGTAVSQGLAPPSTSRGRDVLPDGAGGRASPNGTVFPDTRPTASPQQMAVVTPAAMNAAAMNPSERFLIMMVTSDAG